MLEQTRSAYQRMLAAGWKRGEFRAWTPVDRLHGIKTYGLALVMTVHVQKAVALTPAMQAQGLSLIHFVRNGLHTAPMVSLRPARERALSVDERLNGPSSPTSFHFDRVMRRWS